MPPWSDAWLWWGADRLIAGSIQGAIAAALVWAICRRMTAIPAAVRALLWWLVSLKLALSFVSLPSVGLPLLPAERIDIAPVAAPSTTLQPAVDLSASLSFATLPPASRESAPASRVQWWLTVGMGLWLAGIFVHAVRLLSAFARLRRTLRRSTPIGDEDAAIAVRMARLLGLKATPDVRVSDRVETPLVAGLVRPTVLLPAHVMTMLSPDERAMAICHELAHVRRRDLLFGWVPAIAERLFFFHPFARLATKEYAAEREAACDALVLKAMEIAPHDYGRMLVHLGVSGLSPVFTAGGSSPSRSSLRRRLDMLHDQTFTRSGRGAIALIGMVSAVALIPFHLAARPASVSEVAPPVTPQVVAPAEVRPVQNSPSGVPQGTPPKQAVPVRAQQPPAESRPVAPKPDRGIEQLQKMIADQRSRIAETQESLQKMRLALADAIEQQGLRLHTEAAGNSVDIEQVRRLEEQQRRVDRQLTEQFEIQLKALTREQERTQMMLRQLSEQIEQIRRQIELAGVVRPE